ncbi:conserved hypothetical protein [Methanocella paludicola SANAE]|uniref:Uncharacterized protein n=1 Tax=Methanocella paludicola (strain DSM 17711 / JCM 13418 / NBRC 101707 / SANAE) TaxID=304371 RepID=D1YZI1_METPS|nr:hypothetical protein [Methanocella paludicola]BAI61853.1 conserved hypothetical protein [Methanocella paludicola SANAE]
MYRNATDVTYENLTIFLAANDIEYLVYADPDYKPVEYAALLHDKAEASGINCTIIGSGIVNEVPLNAIVSFLTTDKGPVYVDPTAMNVSQEDYTVPFGEIRLLRDHWTTPTPWTDYNDRYLNITTYRNSTPVSYNALMQFLNEDDTEDSLYVLPGYTCVDFSADLFNNAQAKGIKCAMVSVTFEEAIPGHAFNAFQTTDRGIVFIDCTGINQTCIDDGYLATDNNVYLQVGEHLGELPDNQTNGNLNYAFYADRMERIEAFKDKVNQYLEAVDAYSVSFLKLQADYDSYNDQMAKHNSAVTSFNAENERQYQLYKNDKMTYEEYKSWYDTNIAKIPGAPTGGNVLDSRRSTLNQQYANLEKQRLEILNSEEIKWITFNPGGTVETITTYWS